MLPLSASGRGPGGGVLVFPIPSASEGICGNFAEFGIAHLTRRRRADTFTQTRRFPPLNFREKKTMAKDYDDDDRPARRPSGGEMGPLDKMYRDTNIVILIIFSLCCGIISLVMNLIAFFTAKDPVAKGNAKTALIVSAIMAVIGVIGLIVQFVFLGAAAAGGAR
jgi:hypothetical protein